MATPNFKRTSSFDSGDQLEMVTIDQAQVESNIIYVLVTISSWRLNPPVQVLDKYLKHKRFKFANVYLQDGGLYQCFNVYILLDKGWGGYGGMTCTSGKKCSQIHYQSPFKLQTKPVQIQMGWMNRSSYLIRPFGDAGDFRH